jgi:hypothetical protein
MQQFLNGPLDMVHPYGTLFASFDKTGKQLVPVEGLVAPVALDGTQLYPLNLFVSRVTSLAGQTFPPTTNAVTVSRKTGINHLILKGTALRATHCGAETLFCEFTTIS